MRVASVMSLPDTLQGVNDPGCTTPPPTAYASECSDNEIHSIEEKMPIKSIHVHLDPTLFNPAALQDEIALESAVCVLESYLENPAVDQELLLRDMMARHNLFEFAFSGVSDRVANIAKARIAAMFPRSASAFESSLASSLLCQLSLFFWHHEYPLASLAQCHNSVDLTKPVLKALAAMTFTGEMKSPVSDGVDDEFEGFFVAKRTKQRDRKKNKRAATRTMSIDSKPFERLGVDVPRSGEDALVLEQQILDDQKDILMHYLDTLRKPELAPMFKESYISLGATALANGNNANATQVADDLSPLQQAGGVSEAYPNIQPMKAALYFDSVEGFGDWRILISTRADKNLREAKRDDQKSFAIYLKKIRELSNGHFSDDNQKRLTGSDNDVPIYEAKMTRDTRLVYQVDCIKEFEADVERQVIRIFGIYTHAQLRRNFWDAVSKHVSGRGKEYRKRCIHRIKPVNARDNVYSPATFPPNADMGEPVSPTNLPDLRVDEQQELHSLLVLEKFVTFSQALLHSILADQDVAHVFHMSPSEQEIVKHAGSCYVLGRSGTGKTTTMLFKMLGIERAYDNLRAEYDSELSRPRQLFVTQSRILAEKVQEFYVKLAMSQAAAKRTAEENSKFASQQKAQEEKGLVDRDEEEFHHGTLPKSFKELKDEHFPLFVTFDHLCRLLEADYRKLDRQLDVTAGEQDESQESGGAEVASDYMLQRRQSFVSYITFVNEYWPHLPQSLTKNLDPALIFAEFMGVIKGSEDSVKAEKGYLDREQYLQVSHRQQGTFSSRREAVYTLFQAYLKMKQERREWDAADRTHVMLRGLRDYGVPGKKVDFIYVDEAQDNLLIDALVLRSMCSNPDGLFWAGDTAQTISAGSSFRFDDLKAFLYRLESNGKPSYMKKQPAAFQLTVNYRSHGGIVNAAHSVVQLITKLWPHAIDALSEERGIVNGLKPVFFSGWNQDTVHYEQFLFGASGSQIEFGAQQCILVRDDAARDRLRAQVGDIGLVLTLYESKGLEFNDVLLYNFFEDSTVDEARWRVVLNALPPQKNLKCPQFDETRHSGVCRELKFLYVAITRARKNLWIADCSDKCEPLRTFWNAHNLIDNLSAADNVPRLATTSTPEEWADTARTLFDKRRYLQASRSYERANMMRERDVALAYFLREQARKIPRTRGTIANPRRSALLEAANAFRDAARAASLRSEKLAYYRIAAECYLEADNFEQAGKAYILAEEHTRAAQVFRQGGLFDEAVEAIENYRDKVNPQEAENILSVAKLHYFKNQDLDRATHLFEDIEEALEYMSDYGFNVARVTLLERNGRFGDAATIHLEEGRPIEAIRLFMRDVANPHSRDRAAESVLQGLSNEISFGVPVPSPGSEARSQLDRLLSLSRELTTTSVDSLSTKTRDKLAMFCAIADGDTSLVQTLSQKFVAAHEDSAAALLCLDSIFQKGINIQVAAVDTVLRVLQTFAAYTREMQGVLLMPDPCQLLPVQRLFAFSQNVDQGDICVVRKGSFLHQRISQSRRLSSLVTDANENYQLNVVELTRVLQHAVRERLNRKTGDEDFVCSKATALRLCPSFLAFGNCQASSSCGSTHDEHAVGLEPFRLRIRGLLQQILICQSMRDSAALSSQRIFWLSRLYHALFPAHVKAGSWLDLDIQLIPEAERGLAVVREWLHEFLYTASFKVIGRHSFLTNLAYVITLDIFLEKDSAATYFNRAACIVGEKPHIYLRNVDRYIIQDLRDFLCYDGSTALSAGVLFIKSVLEGRLPIDVGVLCNLLEQLCASYAIAYRMQKYSSLHNVTLSRKWMMKLASEEKLHNQEINLLQMLVNLIPGVLEETYSTQAGRLGSRSYLLTYEGNQTIPYQLRNIFAARLCKSFTLLGYNIPDDRMRTDIHLQILSLKKSRQDARFPKIIQDYMDARAWGGLVRALRRTVGREAGTAEELVNLWQFSDHDPNKSEYKGIEKIIFKKHADIPALLRGELVSDLNPKAAVFMPKQQSLTEQKAEGGDDEEEDAADDLTAPPAEEDSGIDHAIDLEAAARAADRERVEQVAELPTDEELKAAAAITRLYRRKLSYRQSTPKKGYEAELERYYKMYREQPFKQWTDFRYKALFLGFLPLLSFTLETYNAQIIDSKKKARTRIEIAPHHEYENLTAQISTAIAMSKRVNKLKEKAGAKSPFHHKQSESELIALVKEVQALAAELPEGVTSKTQAELDKVVDMIVPKPVVQQTKPIKPELVIDYNDYEVY